MRRRNIDRYSADSLSHYRPTIDRLSTDYRPTVDRLSTDYRPTVDRYIDRVSTAISTATSTDISVDITHSKQDPTTLQFSGIELDSLRQEVRLPSEKIHKCRAQLHQFAQKRSVTLREPQSLIGLLNFWCSVVTPGRAFLRGLIDLTAGVTLPHHYIRLNT